jgi:hypothetical protein
VSTTDSQQQNNNYQNNSNNTQQFPYIRNQNNNAQLIQQVSNNDKWLETFHVNDFKYFIFMRKFVYSFYSTLPKSLEYLKNNLNQNENADLKEKLEQKQNSSKEIVELINSITNSFFENYHCFVIFFLKEYRKQIEIYTKKGYVNYLNSTSKDIKEYFSSTHNFYYNLRDVEDLEQIKNEPIEFIINDKEKEKEKKTLNQLNNMLIVYPDIILSGLLFFFECDEIVDKYYNILLKLFLYIYRNFRDTFYDPLLEHLTKKIMQNKILNEKPDEKNKFMYQFLISLDIVNQNKTILTNEKIIKIFINYLEYYLTQPNFNRKDPYLIQSLHIIIYNISKYELEYKKKFFRIIKCFIGIDLIDTLKWIFTLDDIDNDEIYCFFFYESIPFTIGLILSHFEEGTPLIMNTKNYSKFKILKKYEKNVNENNINVDNNEIISDENEDYKKYDKNNFIKKIVDNCNIITGEKKIEELLDPIHTIILSDTSCHKIFVIVFSQIWEMLNMNEREHLSININDFLYKYISKQKDKNDDLIINMLFDAFSRCSPIIYIKPIIMQLLIPNQNLWCANILYLENLLISGIDVEIAYNSMINIFKSLNENSLANGLKYYFSKNKNSKEAFNELQMNNYTNAEKIFYECFNKLKKDILDKINIDEINLDENNDMIFTEEEFETFNNLSEWENGLIECYENNDKWNNVIELSKINNNIDLELKAIWHSSSDNWQEFGNIIKKNIQQQYNKSDKLKTPFIAQINEIYSNYNNIFEQRNSDNIYQDTCINCIRKIYQDYNNLYPKNIETIDYNFFLIYQLAVEAWESTNIIIELMKNTDNNNIEKKNIKENLLMWRERLPHYCEGYKSIKSILEPRNYLFNTLKTKKYNNFNDKIWTDVYFMKYARKLNLVETFYTKLKIFENENNNNNSIMTYPYEIYCKDIEYITLLIWGFPTPILTF